MRRVLHFLGAFVLSVLFLSLLMLGCNGGGDEGGNNNSHSANTNNSNVSTQTNNNNVTTPPSNNNAASPAVNTNAGVGDHCNPNAGGPFCGDGLYCLVILDDPGGGTCVPKGGSTGNNNNVATPTNNNNTATSTSEPWGWCGDDLHPNAYKCPDGFTCAYISRDDEYLCKPPANKLVSKIGDYCDTTNGPWCDYSKGLTCYAIFGSTSKDGVCGPYF